MPKKLVIFDCDGVLVDSEVIAHRVLVDVLNQQGCFLTVEESIRDFTGINQQESQKILANKYGLTIREDFWESAQGLILTAFEKELVALNQPVLTHLKQQNISVCVASSSQRNRVLKALSVTGQLPFFDSHTIFTSQQVKYGKPAPDLFLFAAAQMGYDPQDCVVVEDSIAGIQAAKAAKMQVIGFLGGTHAQFLWYQQQIQNSLIPLAYNSSQLLNHLTLKSKYLDKSNKN